MKSGYLDARARAVADVVVKDALRMKVKDRHGTLVNYLPKDLVYDLNGPRLFLKFMGMTEIGLILFRLFESLSFLTTMEL